MDAIEFLERIKVIALYFNSLSDAEIKAIKNWIKNTVVDPLAESAIKILEADKREVELMVARNAFILDEMKENAKKEGREEGIKEGIKEGIEKSKLEVVRNSINNGLNDDIICKIADVSIDVVKEIRQKCEKN